MKTKDEGGKGINIPPTQLDNSTQDTPQDKNTEQNNRKLPIDCTEHPRKIVLTRIQQKKDPGKKSRFKQTEQPKIKLNLTLNRFKGLKLMDIAGQAKTKTNKSTKYKT